MDTEQKETMSEQTCNMNESNEGWVKESDYAELKQQRDEFQSLLRRADEYIKDTCCENDYTDDLLEAIAKAVSNG